MVRHKRSKKSYIQLISQYGIHIWAILIIANAAMVYVYQFSTHAAGKTNSPIQTLNVSTTPSSSAQISPSVSPILGPLVGPGINLQFSVPGIGSGGGTMKPLHPKRSVTIYLYSPDVNSMNSTVKPLYTIQTYAVFDSNQYNPTYTAFLNPRIDLGSQVKNGDYQIAFKTDQSLRTLIKQNPTDLGGQIFGLSQTSQIQPIPPQTVLMGDTIPTSGGNNTIDINDYNAFVTCYGNANNTDNFCKTGNYGDFNDDGVIDGIDYNILLRSLYVLSQEGLPVPELTITPSIPSKSPELIHQVLPTQQPKKIAPTPTFAPKNAKVSGKGGSILGGLLFVVFLFVLGVIAFIFRSKIMSLIHMSPTGIPAAENSEITETTPEQTEETEQPAETETQPVAQSNTEQTENAEVPETTTPPAPVTAPTPVAPSEPSTAGDVLEKDCYIKTKGKDEAGTGMWLLLTDDNGALNAHYVKTDAKDGFAKVKGLMKEENGKKFLEVSELTMEG